MAPRLSLSLEGGILVAISLEVGGWIVTPGRRAELDGLTPAAISLCWELPRAMRVTPPACVANGEEVGTQLNVPPSDGGATRSHPHLPGKENLL